MESLKTNTMTSTTTGTLTEQLNELEKLKDRLIITPSSSDNINIGLLALAEIMEDNNKVKDQEDQVRQEMLERKYNYTSATGSYCSWSMEVNLGPPSPIKEVDPPEDMHLRRYYQALQYTLFETGYPETLDRTEDPRQGYTTDDPAIVIMSSPVECMCLLLEGGRQCPGDLILVMSITWLSKVRSDQTENGAESFELYVHKGITSDKGGNTFIDVFDPPRRVTYFMDFFTKACTSGQRCDGEDIERALECPMSSSVHLSRIVDDKLLTRILIAKAGMPYPTTLAFPYKSERTYETSLSGITISQLDSVTGVSNIIEASITKFLGGKAMRSHAKVVVKPSGPMWYESRHVTIHNRDNLASILAAANDILPLLAEGDAILVEAFIDPLQVQPQRNRSIKKKVYTKSRQLSFRVRTTVCRNSGDEAVMSACTCGVGDARQPINGDNTVVQTLAATLRAWGITDPKEYDHIYEDIKRMSEGTLKAIMEYERSLPQSTKGTVGAQTDLIGIDIILTRDESGMLVSFAVDVNSHDCTINNQIFEFINPEYSGKAAQPLITTMLNRSMKYIMKNKKILVIGAGGYSKRFVWEAANDYGIQVYLIDGYEDHYAAGVVKELIPLDVSDHTRDENHTITIEEMIRDRELSLDGCLTFWEDCGPLAAMVCKRLSLPGAGVQGAINAKTKSLTQKVLSGRTADIPHWPMTNLYASKVYRIESHGDIEKAAQAVGFPAIMKLEYGSSAVGVGLMKNSAKCHEYWTQIQKELKTEDDHPGIGLGHGNAMVLMEFLEGTEHDVDIVIFRRKLIAAFVSDNGPTQLPSFTETAAGIPTFLPNCKKNQLIKAAYQCCIEIGLENGTFNVEMKMTATGPKLIEVNGRMGGFYLRDWIKRCYNVDMLLCSFAIACGVKPLGTATEPSRHIIGLMLTPSKHTKALTRENVSLLQKMAANGHLCFNQFEESVQCDEYEEPFCNIAVESKNREEAKLRLLEIGKVMGIDSEAIPLSYWFEDICD